jgi:ABC-type lipoprotein release transport system permease subunit
MVTENVGHVQIHQRDYPGQRAPDNAISGSTALLRKLKADPTVAQAVPRVHGAALLGARTTSTGALIIGVDPAAEAALTRLDQKIVRGRALKSAAQGEIIVGHELAKKLKVEIGDELVAVTQAVDGSLGNELYRVVGLYRSDNVAQDCGGAFVHIRDAQTLLGLDDQVHEIALVAADPAAADALASATRALVADQDLLVRTWYQVTPQLKQILQLYNSSILILVVIIFGVAGIGVLNTMLMSVFERTKELGLVGALGLRPWQMIALVLAESIALAAVAIGAGTPLGLGLDAYLIWHGFDLRWVSADMSFMGTTFGTMVYAEFHFGRVIEITAGLFAISLLAAIWPALRAARLQPVAAMRAE